MINVISYGNISMKSLPTRYRKKLRRVSVKEKGGKKNLKDYSCNVRPTRSKEPAQKVVGTINADGYRLLLRKGHPNSSKNGRIMEHTYVLSQALGRALEKGEYAFHKNGIRDDNRIQNLELRQKKGRGHNVPPLT